MTGLAIPRGENIETIFSAVSITSREELKSQHDALASSKSVGSKARNHSSAGKEVTLWATVDQGRARWRQCVSYDPVIVDVAAKHL